MTYTLEQIEEEIKKIESLKVFDIIASSHSLQVYDRRTNDMLIDADFKDSFIENMIDGLFGWGSLYEYLKTKI